MPLEVATHPTAETLAAFNSGMLPEPERARVESHIAGCDSCCSQLAAMSDDRLVGLARKAAADLPATTAMVNLSDVPPELIDHPRYRVISPLGAGGMGVVYKVEDLFMGRTVALKVVARRYTSNAAAIERFRREVRAAAKLNHHNIVTAHDTGEVNGLHFLVMEYVEGISLDRLVQRKGPLPVATACQCIRQAAQGLQHAFEKGMVHRDIKPHNLMVTKKGQIKLLDFGLARVVAETDLPPLPGGTQSPDRTVTSASLVMGTPDYLAPEQTRNAHAVDIRADIYALGCVLYYLLTGKPPFSRFGTAMEKMLAHVQDDPEPIRKIRPEVPIELADVLARMMAKKPENRFATPAEIANALKPFARGEAIIDESPDIIDTPTAPTVEVPTATIAVADTQAAPRVRVKRKKRKKLKKRPKRRPVWPFVVVGSTALLIVSVIGLIIALGGTNRDPGAEPNQGGGAGTGGVAGAKPVLFIVPSRGLYYPDYGPVKDRLTKGGIEVVTASTQLDDCQLEAAPAGERVKPVKLVSSLKASDYSAILFCGRDMREYINESEPSFQQVRQLLEDARNSRKIIFGGICMGQGALLKHRALQGLKVARCPNIPAAIYSQFGAKPGKLNVARDGFVITASHPDDAIPFADAILAAIKK